MDMDRTEERKLRDKLQLEAMVLERSLAKVRRVISELGSLLGDREGSPPDPARNGTVHPDLAVSRPDRLDFRHRQTRYHRIYRALEAAGGPLKTNEIADALIKQGDRPPGSSPQTFKNTVDSALRSGEQRGYFRKVGVANWDLEERAAKTK